MVSSPTPSPLAGEDAFDRAGLAAKVKRLAEQRIYIGTSSWKYVGWCGQIYDKAKYEYRGKFAESRFERDCLKEYSETFKTVCVDATYYSFPRVEYLQGLAAQVPDDFRLSFKSD